MKNYQSQINNAITNLNTITTTEVKRKLYFHLLTQANLFLKFCLSNKTITESNLNTYLSDNRYYIETLTQIVTNEQVTYWNAVILQWKTMLGTKWRDTYAVVDYIYVSPEHNIFLQLLKKHMQQNMVNTRLFSFNTKSYEPSVNDALDLLVIKEPDHELSEEIFGKEFNSYASILPTSAIRALHNQ